MLEKPTLSDSAITACLRANYDIAVADLAFLPIGNDAAAWAYRTQTADGTSYFLKVRTGRLNEPGLSVPRYLHDHGLPEAVAPFPTTTQALRTSIEGFTLIMYPFIEGRTGMEGGLSAQQWIAYGAALRRLHATALPSDLARRVRRESFVPAWRDTVTRLDAHIAAHTFTDPEQRTLAAFWRERRAEIRAIVERATVLGQPLRWSAGPRVLCHADIHTANLLLDAAGNLWIVDWDETILAPIERDLMFVTDGDCDGRAKSREETLFFEGYGPVAIDPVTLAYYRYEWAVQEIGDYGQRVFLTPGIGSESKRDALVSFEALFAPGDVVSQARAADGCASG